MNFQSPPLKGKPKDGVFGGQAMRQVERELARQSIQPSPDIMVSRTSRGTFLRLREKPSGDTSTTTTYIQSGSRGVQNGYYNTIRATTPLLTITGVNGPVGFCGTATIMSNSTVRLPWIAQPIPEQYVGIIAADEGVQEAMTYASSSGLLYPRNRTAVGFGGGVNLHPWMFDEPHPSTANLMLVRLEHSLTINIADEGDPDNLFTADYMDMNTAGRRWVKAP